METVPLELARQQLAAVLREAVDGSPERWSYFTRDLLHAEEQDEAQPC